MCKNVQQLIGLSYSLSEVSAFNSHGFKSNWPNEGIEHGSKEFCVKKRWCGLLTEARNEIS